MAKSKNGGTRAYIRGRIGSDVYSVGKNGKGERQQVVRSLAESVANPRTSSQMFGRMVMSTVMQAVSALQPIIDHSFDGVAKGQPSISEFIRRNYALVKADAIAHPASGNSFALSLYQQKGVVNGPFIISNGNAQLPSGINVDEEDGISVTLGSDVTVGGFKALWGLSKDEFITVARPSLNARGSFEGVAFVRVSFDFGSVADTTTLTQDVLEAALKQEGTTSASVSLENDVVSIKGTNATKKSEVIVSRIENGAYIHSTAYFHPGTPTGAAADTALPTYPTGSEMFLNGGDL